MSAIQRAIGGRFTPRIDLDAEVVSLRDQITGDAQANLLFLWAGVLIVLLVATANIANLMTARATRRHREMAIRLAVGASRQRLMLQTIVEALLLTGLGAVSGTALAYASVPLLLRVAPPSVPRLDEIAIDATALTFTAGLAVVAGLLVGCVAGVRAGRTGLIDAVRPHALADLPRDRAVRRVLAAAQVALTMVCVASAGLLVESLANVLRVDRGFRTDHLLTVSVAASGPRYRSPDARAALVRDAVDRLRMVPGVVSVGVANKVPLSGTGMHSLMVAAGTENAPISLQDRPRGDVRSVNGEYFATLAIPLLRGRAFDERDGERDLAVVSTAAAARLWPGQDPLGQRFRLTADPQRTFEVIGVAGDVRAAGLDLSAPLSVYLPYARGFMGNIAFAIRTRVAPASLSGAVRDALHAVDADLAVAQMQPMDDLVTSAVATRRFEAGLLGAFAVVALVLAAVGVYGVLAFGVAQRTREIGVRLALGATSSIVRRMVIRDAAAMVTAGIVVGAPAALAAGFGLRGLLFGVPPSDPIAVMGAGVLLSVAGLIAAYIPSRRAATVDPMVSLRTE
jgi:putative ABC transport system permease protein